MAGGLLRNFKNVDFGELAVYSQVGFFQPALATFSQLEDMISILL